MPWANPNPWQSNLHVKNPPHKTNYLIGGLVSKDIINDILEAGKNQIFLSKDIENDILVCRMHCEQAWCAGIRKVVLKKLRYKFNSGTLLLQNKNTNKEECEREQLSRS